MPRPIPTDAEAFEALRVFKAWLAASTSSAPAAPIFTRDPELEAKTGHTARSLEDAIHRHELVGVKVKRGFRVEASDLRTWEQRPRVRPGPRRREERDVKPANVAPPPRALHAVPQVDEDDELLARAVAGGGRRR